MQSAKDTFLMMLRDRLTLLNPARTVEVRGALRTAVIATENELPQAQGGDVTDCFVLRWLSEERDTSEPLPLHSLRCEIAWGSRGTNEFGGLDRGRVLSAMEAELRRVLQPAHTPKRRFGQSARSLMETELFWGGLSPVTVTTEADRVRAMATVAVFALEEGNG